MSNPKRGRASPWLILSGVCFAALIALIVICVSLIQSSTSVVPNPRGQPSLGVTGVSEGSDFYLFPRVDWEYWQGVNPDVVGWVTVPGTSINHAIVQAPASDPTFYLSHDIYGAWSPFGCPYVDAECDGLTSLNVYIFGHHMVSSAPMFADFARYSNRDFAQKHSTILLQTPQKQMVLAPSSAKIIRGSEPSKRADIDEVEKLRTWYAERYVAADMTMTNDSEMEQLFTFVTCSYNYFSNERTIVHSQIQSERILYDPDKI